MDTTTSTSLRKWVFQGLPALNTAAETGTLGPADVLEAVQYQASTAATGSLESLTKEKARNMLQLLGFCMSSVERHYQAAGAERGFALRRLEPLTAFIRHLGAIGEHIPRDSVYTYWLWNRSAPILTFTGDPQERFFNTAVVRTDDLNLATCALLRPICNGDVPIFAPEASRAIEQAAANMRDIRRLYNSFMVVDPDLGRRPIEPEFFAFRMRSYLTTYPVGGQVWSGVNAGNLCSQIQADHLIGTVTEWYSTTVVPMRWPYLIPEDRRALEQDMAQFSILDRILQGLRLGRADLTDRPELLAQRLTSVRGAKSALEAFDHLVQANAEQSATHFGLIVNFLQKVESRMTQEEHKHLPVSTKAGTGGMTHDVTRQIMEMRRNHPTITPLFKLVKIGLKEAKEVIHV